MVPKEPAPLRLHQGPEMTDKDNFRTIKATPTIAPEKAKYTQVSGSKPHAFLSQTKP